MAWLLEQRNQLMPFQTMRDLLCDTARGELVGVCIRRLGRRSCLSTIIAFGFTVLTSGLGQEMVPRVLQYILIDILTVDVFDVFAESPLWLVMLATIQISVRRSCCMDISTAR